MPIDFPSSPTLGQEFVAGNGTTYVFTGYGWRTKSKSITTSDVVGLQAALDGKATSTHNHDGTYEPVGSVASHATALDPHTGYQKEPTASDTPPVNPQPFDRWFDTTTGTMLFAFNDGDSTQWIPETPAGGGGGGRTLLSTTNISGNPTQILFTLAVNKSYELEYDSVACATDQFLQLNHLTDGAVRSSTGGFVGVYSTPGTVEQATFRETPSNASFQIGYGRIMFGSSRIRTRTDNPCFYAQSEVAANAIGAGTGVYRLHNKFSTESWAGGTLHQIQLTLSNSAAFTGGTIRFYEIT